MKVTIAACLLSVGFAFPSNRNRVPNGFRVPCTEGALGCKDGLCQGFAHATCHGGTFPLNAFGTDLAAMGHKWTTDLCNKDSDGDGLTNGEELGDPCCLWNAWDIPSDYQTSFTPSHPGVASSKIENYKKPDCAVTASKVKAPVMGKFNPGEVQKMAEVLVDNYTIPFPGSLSTRTTYVDIAWNFPDTSADLFHVVYAEGIVNGPETLHHYVILGCRDRWPAEKNGKPVTAFERDAAGCTQTWGGWVPGRSIMELPDWAGRPVGKDAGVQSFAVNIHYDNPNLKKGVVSTDGMRIYYTPTLRPSTMDMLSTMQVSYNPTMIIPKNKPRYFMTRSCKLTVEELYTQKPAVARVLGHSAHAHLLGREMYAERIRGNDRYTITDDPLWYFDDQYQANVYARNITFQTGDILQTTCVFDSSGREKDTPINLETTDEMCWSSFLMANAGNSIKCDGHIWTGTLQNDEAALGGIEIRHPESSGDGIWDGASLRSGGKKIDGKKVLLCEDMPQIKELCPQILARMPKDLSSEEQNGVCDSTMAELGMRNNMMADMTPLGLCCSVICKGFCTTNPVCKDMSSTEKDVTKNTSAGAGPGPGKDGKGGKDGMDAKDGKNDTLPEEVKHNVKAGTKVTQVVTLKGLDYDKVTADATVKDTLVKAVKDTFLKQLPSGYTEKHLAVALSKGSVKADVTITPMSDSASATSQMIETMGANKDAMQSTLVKAVQEMPNVASILEEGKTPSDVTVTTADPVFEAVGAVASTTKPDEPTPVSHAVKSKVSAYILGWLVAILASAGQ